jgi:hypothetical protein
MIPNCLVQKLVLLLQNADKVSLNAPNSEGNRPLHYFVRNWKDDEKCRAVFAQMVESGM